tara:strand:+ start:26173 stop:26358 length:186 start_codon:yes stop_codon:yes gene_type:complete
LRHKNPKTTAQAATIPHCVTSIELKELVTHRTTDENHPVIEKAVMIAVFMTNLRCRVVSRF